MAAFLAVLGGTDAGFVELDCLAVIDGIRGLEAKCIRLRSTSYSEGQVKRGIVLGGRGTIWRVRFSWGHSLAHLVGAGPALAGLAAFVCFKADARIGRCGGQDGLDRRSPIQI